MSVVEGNNSSLVLSARHLCGTLTFPINNHVKNFTIESDVIMESGLLETWEAVSSQKSLTETNASSPRLPGNSGGDNKSSKTWWVYEG